jgi:hypothetical protein
VAKWRPPKFRIIIIRPIKYVFVLKEPKNASMGFDGIIATAVGGGGRAISTKT